MQLKAFINFPKRIDTSVGFSNKILFSLVTIGFMAFFFFFLHIKKRAKNLLLSNNRDSVQRWHELCVRAFLVLHIVKNHRSC